MLAVFSISFYACKDDEDDDNTDNVTQQDRNFARDAADGNLAEIEFGRVAIQRATNDSVIAFAQDMITDHTAAQRMLDSISNVLNVTLPDSMNVTHRRLLDSLSTMNGVQFDSVYIHNQVLDHQATRTLLQSQISNGNNRRLVDYASKNLPIVNGHLQRVQNLQDSLRNN